MVETRLNQPCASEDDQSDLHHVNMTHLRRSHIVDGPQNFPLSPTQWHGKDMGRTRYLSGVDPLFRDSPPRVEINSDPGYGRMGSDFCCAIADLSAVSIYPPVLRDEPWKSRGYIIFCVIYLTRILQTRKSFKLESRLFHRINLH